MALRADSIHNRDVATTRTGTPSTVELGDELEDAVADFLRNDIQTGAYGVPSLCTVHQKEKYWSPARNDYIVVDVSVQVSHPGATQYSMLWIVECKNEGRRASVGDVELLCSRMNQISEGSTKGLLVSRAGFQRGALSFARTKGVALLRWANEKFRWELRRQRGNRYVGARADRIRAALEGEPLETGVSPTPLLTAEGTYSGSLSELFLGQNTLSPNRDAPDTGVPFVTADELERHAANSLKRLGYVRGPVSIEALLRQVQVDHGLNVREESRSVTGHGTDVLAALRFDPLELVIHPHTGLPESSLRFTLAHEIAHVLLGHGDHLLAELFGNREADLTASIDHVDVARMEVQANLMASALLLPREALLRELAPLVVRLGLVDKGYGLLFLDRQSANQRNWSTVANALTVAFGVSVTVLRLRLRALGILAESLQLPVALDAVLRRTRG